MKSWFLCVTVLAGLLLRLPAGALPDPIMKSPIKSDETVHFFTSAAWPAGPAGAWETEVRGIIFEAERNRLLEAALRRALGIDTADLSTEQQRIMEERLPLFLQDNERGKAIPVRLGDTLIELPESAPNGHFRGRVQLEAAPAGPLTVKALLRPGDERQFAGQVLLMEDGERPLVISDIDDTIKVTEVRDRRAAIRRTFCEPFEAVPGMAARYRQWMEHSGADYHYVSGSPWQLYPPLEAFVREAEFPAGAWHLKHLRLADPSTVAAFLGPQQEHKLAAIQSILERWKRRRLVLVGDTGEQDPEIYGEVARRHAGRVQQIFIRNVSGESAAGSRMAAAFKEVPAEKWRLFEHAGELPEKLTVGE